MYCPHKFQWNVVVKCYFNASKFSKCRQSLFFKFNFDQVWLINLFFSNIDLTKNANIDKKISLFWIEYKSNLTFLFFNHLIHNFSTEKWRLLSWFASLSPSPWPMGRLCQKRTMLRWDSFFLFFFLSLSFNIT